jgi:hypothetical protein
VVFPGPTLRDTNTTLEAESTDTDARTPTQGEAKMERKASLYRGGQQTLDSRRMIQLMNELQSSYRSIFRSIAARSCLKRSYVNVGVIARKPDPISS